MTAAAAAGDIMAQAAVAIDDDDTALSLGDKLVTAARELLDEVLPKLLDGSARGELFDELLRAAAERGIQFVPLRQLMDAVEFDRLPRARIEARAQPGREGWVAWQEGAA